MGEGEGGGRGGGARAGLTELLPARAAALHQRLPPAHTHTGIYIWWGDRAPPLRRPCSRRHAPSSCRPPRPLPHLRLVL